MNIKELRLAAHMKQVELAAEMGTSQSTVSAWESGASFPSAAILPKLADVLHCTIDALYGRDESA